jgi:hypothetical protein
MEAARMNTWVAGRWGMRDPPKLGPVSGVPVVPGS